MTKAGPTTTLESVVVSVLAATGGPVGAPRGPPLDLSPGGALECYQKPCATAARCWQQLIRDD